MTSSTLTCKVPQQPYCKEDDVDEEYGGGDGFGEVEVEVLLADGEGGR